MASVASPLGQMLFKHFSTAEARSEQIHDKSLMLEHRAVFWTWAIHANKQAGGVAKTWGKAAAKTIKAESFNMRASGR